jgi:hypothetical protein
MRRIWARAAACQRLPSSSGYPRSEVSRGLGCAIPDPTGLFRSSPAAGSCSTSLMVVVLTTRTISMKAAAFFVEALLARARRTRGRSARVLRQDGARGLSPRIGSQ